MRGRGLLAAFLLGVGLCFVPALGYGEIPTWMYEQKASYISLELLRYQVSYLMRNPTNFLGVQFTYDPTGYCGEVMKLPEGVSTKGKIFVLVADNRGLFSYKSGIALRDLFKRELKIIYSFIIVAKDVDADIVAKFYSRGDIPLGYFYQGEYHLWEKS
ncbi:hypothetical protein ES702_07780 [subsurface metagenome]